MLDRPHSVIVDMTAMRQAKQQLAEFENNAVTGRYETFIDDVRNAQRNVLMRASKLSPREVDIFGAMAMGRQIKVVAADLGLSMITIKVELRGVKKKLSEATGTKIDSTVKMALLYWGITAKSLATEQERLPDPAPKRRVASTPLLRRIASPI